MTKYFISVVLVFMALSSSAIDDKASAGRHHQPHHHGHRHHRPKSDHLVPFKPAIPNFTIPFFPAVHNVTWNFNIKGWPYGKTFTEGDILVFNYDKDLHNVVPVSEADYQNCSVPDSTTVYSSGEDAIMLQRGVNYFICGTMGHCIAGMLIAVAAT